MGRKFKSVWGARITFEPQRTARDWVTPLWLAEVRVLWLGPIRIDLSRGR